MFSCKEPGGLFAICELGNAPLFGAFQGSRANAQQMRGKRSSAVSTARDAVLPFDVNVDGMTEGVALLSQQIFCFAKSLLRGVSRRDFNGRYRPPACLSLFYSKPLVRGKLGPAAEGNPPRGRDLEIPHFNLLFGEVARCPRFVLGNVTEGVNSIPSPPSPREVAARRADGRSNCRSNHSLASSSPQSPPPRLRSLFIGRKSRRGAPASAGAPRRISSNQSSPSAVFPSPMPLPSACFPSAPRSMKTRMTEYKSPGPKLKKWQSRRLVKSSTSTI